MQAKWRKTWSGCTNWTNFWCTYIRTYEWCISSACNGVIQLCHQKYAQLYLIDLVIKGNPCFDLTSIQLEFKKYKILKRASSVNNINNDSFSISCQLSLLSDYCACTLAKFDPLWQPIHLILFKEYYEKKRTIFIYLFICEVVSFLLIRLFIN